MMISKNSTIQTVITRLKKMPAGSGLDLRTFKRDRSVKVVLCGDGTYRIEQDGFEQRVMESVPEAKLKKVLQTLLDKEFPRSNKVRVYEMNIS